MLYKFTYLILVCTLLFGSQSYGQSSKKDQLEARRTQLQKDQIYINSLLSNAKKKESNLLNDLKDIKRKIKTRDEIISVISKESKELGNEIYLNQLDINKYKRELDALKKDYAVMINKSYQSKSENSRIMFLLSSENFYQAYKRFQYMKQYASYRKNQGVEILDKTEKLQVLVDNLQEKKNKKQELLGIEKKEQTIIEKEKKEQEGLLGQVKKQEGKYKRQIAQAQREEARIDAQIDKIIRDAIASSNKKSDNTTNESSSAAPTFALTPEAKELASKFTSNKGQLPWPVEKGFVSTYYGKQPHPIVASATIQSNGVRITTSEGSRARSVFEGVVLAIQVTTGNKKAVLIQHGNYITVYKNLEDIFVKNGDKVSTKQEIGTIFTDKVTGKTILGFILSKNTDTENPASWILRM